ncbi:MAG: hypothetical protein A3E88_00760 [Legionellales bacterium RIFCSPHIGHO2_12_FULL_35_11]|nr:MAG: hypothetical protein A3E88_00760 [Legionellales bacterium RIFCSPHIGHO2_12_FULL_35_11]
MLVFLFTNFLNEDIFLSLRLDAIGKVDEPLKNRSLSEFREISENSKIYVILPSNNITIFDLELPLLKESKLRPVIMYALEDEIAEPVINLHFCYSKEFYFDEKFLVAIIQKHLMQELQSKLLSHSIKYDLITSSWFALNIGESCVIDDTILINEKNFKGSIDLDLLESHSKYFTLDSQPLVFKDTKNYPEGTKLIHCDDRGLEWVAKRIFNNRVVNFCQGEFYYVPKQHLTNNYAKISAYLGAFWIISLILTDVINIFVLNTQLKKYTDKISVIYKEFFPKSSQVISPKFRVGQILKESGASSSNNFWDIINKFTNSIYLNSATELVKVSEMRYKNKSLVVKITLNNFTNLEQIEKNLKSSGAVYKKLNINDESGKLVVSMEISS